MRRMINKKQEEEINQKIKELYQLIEEDNKEELEKMWLTINPEIFVMPLFYPYENISILSRLCKEGNLDYIRYIIENPYMMKVSNRKKIINDFIIDGALYACKAPTLDVLKYIASWDVKGKYIFHPWKENGLNYSQSGQNLLMLRVIKKLLESTYPKNDIIEIIGSWLKNKDDYLPSAIKFYTLKRMEDSEEDLNKVIKVIQQSNPQLESWLAVLLNGTLIDDYDFSLIHSIIEIGNVNIEKLKKQMNNSGIIDKLWLNLSLNKDLTVNAVPTIKGKI